MSAAEPADGFGPGDRVRLTLEGTIDRIRDGHVIIDIGGSYIAGELAELDLTSVDDSDK